MQIYVRVLDILRDRGMTQKELAEKAGLRPAAVSDLVNNRRDSINRRHLCAIAEALEIEDIAELVTFK